MSFALHPNKIRLPPLYLMFTEDDFAPTPGTRSHAKKKPADYIPRPKNAFIIFRTLYSKWNATLPRVANPNRPDDPVAISDHRSLSRHAGEAWRCMTEDEKAPYKELADEDKAQHRAKHPDYKYSPGERAPTRKVLKKGRLEKRSESPPSSASESQSVVDDLITLYRPPRKRSSSCPPNPSQSWDVALPEPLPSRSTTESAPVFTNPWSASNSLLYPPDDIFNNFPDQRHFDIGSSWSRRSKDDFAVSYGASRSFTPASALCNSFGEFSKRLSRYDTSSSGYYSSTLSSALVHQSLDTWSPMPMRDVSLDVPPVPQWDRKKSRDDLDMHLFGPSISRTRRGQDVRKGSIDDFSVNYGSSARTHEWNQGFTADVDLNPLRMPMPNEYHSQIVQGPPSEIPSSHASPISMQDFAPLNAYPQSPPYVDQQIPSSYLALSLDTDAPRLSDFDSSSITPLEHIEQKVNNQYDGYGTTSENFDFTEFVHHNGHATIHDALGDATAESDYVHAMSMYQQGLAEIC